MRSCDNCLENNWSYEKIEDFIRATCSFCDYEVMFEAKKNKNEKVTDKTLCRHCKGKIILKKRKPLSQKILKKLKSGKQKYYYTHYYMCINCYKMYMPEKFKVLYNNGK